MGELAGAELESWEELELELELGGAGRSWEGAGELEAELGGAGGGAGRELERGTTGGMRGRAGQKEISPYIFLRLNEKMFE
jgi:hypothetical protein